MAKSWEPPYYYSEDYGYNEKVKPITVIRDALEWIARPHGLTEKRCPKDERLREAEDMATVALEALAAMEEEMK